MHKKEYELIAELFKLKNLDLNDSKQMGYSQDIAQSIETLSELAEDFADRLQLEYANFDRTKFLTACGIEEKS